jgi:hypothetical protein
VGLDSLVSQLLRNLITKTKASNTGEVKFENIAGLISDIDLWTKSEIGSILNDPAAGSILEWFNTSKIIYVNLNTLAYEETSRRLGRFIIQDLKTSIQYVQSISKNNRKAISVYLDEFASIASSGFIELLNKARSANVRLTLAHQSLGDLTSISNSFASQVMDNTNVKIIFRLDSPDTCEFFARLIGTRKSAKQTFQVNHSGIFGSNETGMGTTRATEEFIVSPNSFRKLGRGESFVITKIPYQISRCKLNPISEWIKIYNQLEQKRRIMWPKFSKELFS